MADSGSGYVGPSDVATLSLLGRGGYGYGGHGYGHTGGDSVLAAQAHADGTAIAEKIDNAAQVARDARLADLVAATQKSVADLKDEVVALDSRRCQESLADLKRQSESKEQTTALLAAMQAQTAAIVAALNNGD